MGSQIEKHSTPILLLLFCHGSFSFVLEQQDSKIDIIEEALSSLVEFAEEFFLKKKTLKILPSVELIQLWGTVRTSEHVLPHKIDKNY